MANIKITGIKWDNNDENVKLPRKVVVKVDKGVHDTLVANGSKAEDLIMEIVDEVSSKYGYPIDGVRGWDEATEIDGKPKVRFYL